jgi:hypothetical protein
MGTLEGKDSGPRVTIRFLAPFRGRDNWSLEVPITPGEPLSSVFQRLEAGLCRELKEKVIDPPHPPFGVNVNGKRVVKDQFEQVRLTGSEQISILALLVGG